MAPNFAERALTATVEIKAGRGLGDRSSSEEGLAVTARHVIDGTGSSGASVQVRLFANQPGERMTSAIVFFSFTLHWTTLCSGWRFARPLPHSPSVSPRHCAIRMSHLRPGLPGLSNTVSRGSHEQPARDPAGHRVHSDRCGDQRRQFGRPLIDEHGRVVGINLMGLASSLGDIDAADFALPLDYLLDDVNDALRRGREK